VYKLWRSPSYSSTVLWICCWKLINNY
jgi:hypothetical protein